MAAESPKKQTQFKPKQTQSPKSQNEYKLIYNKGLQKKRLFLSPNKQTQSCPPQADSKMNVNLYIIEDYENEPPSGPKKQTQFKPNLVRRRRIRKAKIACRKIWQICYPKIIRNISKFSYFYLTY